MPNALLVYPKTPRTFWSYEDSLKLVGKKAVFPPAGALTVAGLMPKDFNIKLTDTNTGQLNERDLGWADVVITSSMIIHWRSLEGIIQAANKLKKPVMTGGPLSTQYHKEIKGNATFFLGEAEYSKGDLFLGTLDDILSQGYRKDSSLVGEKGLLANIKDVPSQRFDLVQHMFKDYAAMAIQTTRGCPEPCTFCNIPELYGKITRIKSGDQILTELDALYNLGWKGRVMIVDDNIVGNQKEIIPRLNDIAEWQRPRKYPFSLFTQASLRMYDNPELMEAMYQAGISQVFFGLESPSEESLKSMGARKNMQGDKSMADKIKEIQANYFKAQSGFILGFDQDPDNIAEIMKDFIQETNIGVAMVGPLGVLPDTPDYKRYERQGRLVKDVKYAGDSGILTRKLSFIPQDKDGNKIDPEIILNRHKEVLEFVNDPSNYYNRVIGYLKNRERKPLAKMGIGPRELGAVVKMVYQQGLTSDYKSSFWKGLAETFMNDPRDVPAFFHYSAEGMHLINTTRESLKVNEVNTRMERLMSSAKNIGDDLRHLGHGYIQDLVDVVEKYKRISKDFREHVQPEYRTLIERLAT